MHKVFTDDAAVGRCTKHRADDSALCEMARINGELYVKRVVDLACCYEVPKYEIVLERGSIECAGCRKRVRSTRHICKPPEKAWLGKHLLHVRHKVRAENFKLLAERLPYAVVDDVLNACNDTVPACRAIVFCDVVATPRTPDGVGSA